MDDAITPQMIRNAAALATEAGSDPTGQAAVDVFHVVKNRLKHGGYGNSFDELWTRGMNGGPIQFEGPAKRGYAAFLNIRTLEDAVKWSGTSASVLKSYIKTLGDPTMQQKSAAHVGRALEFRASPKNLGKTLENTAWRGTDNDNQFLTGPKDPLLSLALYNKILPKTKPTSTNSFVERADARLNEMLPPGAGKNLDWKPSKNLQITKTEKPGNPVMDFLKTLQIGGHPLKGFYKP
jgi:hypothetical protein